MSAATITTGGSVISPDAFSSYESERAGGTIVHPILGSSDPDTTLRPALLREGSFALTFTRESAEYDSRAAEAVLSAGAVFTLLSPERTSVAMAFVVPQSGGIKRSLSSSGGAWVVTVDYQEVAT